MNGGVWSRSVVGSAVAVLVSMLAATLLSCTPKPDDVGPVVEAFFAALSRSDASAAAAMTDRADAAEVVLGASLAGLQAERASAQVQQVRSDSNDARAAYTVSWDLVGERKFSYTTEMNLFKHQGQWKLRWQPQVLHPKLGTGQHLELRSIAAERANVVTADGVSVLQPGVAYRVLIDPRRTDDVEAVVRRVVSALDVVRAHDETTPQVDVGKVAAELEQHRMPYSVVVLSQAQGLGVRKELGQEPAVSINEEAALVRSDPTFAPDIVARVEKVVTRELDGADGWQVAAVNSHGALIDALEIHRPTVAPAVRLSVDHKIQVAAQQAVDSRSDMKAMMVAIRPATGEILAVAQTEKADEDGNIALMGQYPPGSTFKIITAAAGIDSEGMTPQTVVPCPGTMDIGHRVVTNYNQFSRGNVPLDSAFAASCNTSFADISSRLNPGELKNYAKQFGLGVDYTIDGLDTLTGSVPEGKELVDRVEAGFGQGKDLASPFGMALVAATAAAGKTPTPVLISGHSTAVTEQPTPPSPEAIAGVQQMMRSVVTSGTARGMQAGGEIHGKTGEAEVADGSHAWFAGYRGDIAFATLIVLGGGSQSAVAMTDQFFRILDGDVVLE